MGEASSALTNRGRTSTISKLVKRREIGAILAVLVLVAAGLFIRTDVFARPSNFVGILRNTATVAIIGYGMTLLMVSGEFDLSVGSWMAVTGALTIILFLDGWPILFVIAFILLLSALYGLFQGLLVTKLGLPSLIVTIGTLTLLRGVLLVILDSVTITIPSNSYPDVLFYLGGATDLSSLPFLGIEQFPNQIFWTFGLLVVGYYVLNKTAFGYRSQFTGGDVDSADRTGIKTDHVKIINFMLVAVLAAFAGIGQLAFTQAVGPLTGQGVELIVIAAVVIGGTNLFGGEGSMLGTFLGALVFALTQNVLVLAGLGSQLFQIFTGLFVIAAVLIEVLSREIRPTVVVNKYVEPLAHLVTEPNEFLDYVRTDVQGIDKPLSFITISTVVLSALLLGLLYVGDALVPWEFSFLIVTPGVSAFGTIPLLTFGMVGALTLLSSAFLHIAVKSFGSERDFDTTLQAVVYSLAPSVLLFVPILLSGWAFTDIIVFGTVGLIVIPILYLLYKAVRILHDLSTRNAALSVTFAVATWVVVALYVLLQVL